MMHSASVITSLPISVGNGYLAFFRYDEKGMTVAWHPDEPKGRTKKNIIPAYIAARNQFLESVAQKTGLKIAVAGHSIDFIGGG